MATLTTIDDFTGIPGSIGEDAKRIRWIRQPDHPSGRPYLAEVADGILVALVSHDEVRPGKRLWHVSVSHRDRSNKPDRCPNWDELKHAAYRLIQADVPLVLIFPRRSAPYVNNHPTTLHLWESDKEIDL